MVSVPPLRGRLGGGYSSLDRVVSIDLELSLNFISFMVFSGFCLNPQPVIRPFNYKSVIMPFDVLSFLFRCFLSEVRVYLQECRDEERDGAA